MLSEDVVQPGDGCSISSEDGDGSIPVSVGTPTRMHTDFDNTAESSLDSSTITSNRQVAACLRTANTYG